MTKNEDKDVKDEAVKLSEEDALRERIGEAKGAKKAAEDTTSSEGAAKAEKFKAYLKEEGVAYFDEPRSFDDEYHTTRFDSRIEVKGQVMPMAIFVDDSIFAIIRTNVATGINEKNVDRIKNYLNALNAEYKIFKYYLREDGSIYLDICVPAVSAMFDSRMVHTLVEMILVKHLDDTYEDLMAEVWGKN